MKEVVEGREGLTMMGMGRGNEVGGGKGPTGRELARSGEQLACNEIEQKSPDKQW